MAEMGVFSTPEIKMVATILVTQTEMEVDPTEVVSETKIKMEIGSTTINNKTSTTMVSDPDHRTGDSLTMGSEMAPTLGVPETPTSSPEVTTTMGSTMGPEMALFPTPGDQVTLI